MWVVVVCTIVAIALFVVGVDEFEGGGRILPWFIAALIFLVPLAYYAFGPHPKADYVYDSDIKIYALEDNVGTEGYHYYHEVDADYFYLAGYKGGKKMYSLSKDECYVTEDAEVEPHIEVFRESFPKASKLQHFFYDWTLGGKEYRFVVPPKTLTDKYNVDMK